MKNATDRHESSSHAGELAVPPGQVIPPGGISHDSPERKPAAPSAADQGDSPTVSFVSTPERLIEPGNPSPDVQSRSLLSPDASDALVNEPVNESDKTVISQRPVAPPAEFYRSAPLAELAATLEGKQLDHFSVQTMIGGGGMGAVFRGVDTRLDRVVAVKVIPASRRDPETLRRFRLEAQAAARLDHPNIARVYYVGEAEPWNYIVFEFIDGINIRDLVEMEGPLAIDDAVFYTRQVAEALQHAHEREVVHRDVKPSNVLVTASGIAKLVDMGLARDTSLERSTADATASGVTLGTFDYISPEQARNPRDADVRSDLYSLGCTLFYMLTGNPPFPEGTALQKLLSHGSIPPPDPRQLRPDISDQLYEILMKLMTKKPSDRYQKPIELVNDLLLLAEVENLPRSQGPSTLLLRPSIAQRSLMETHLPWIVASIALLGSSLWLQSIQSLPGGLTLPELKFDGATSVRNDAPSVDRRVPTVPDRGAALRPVPDPGASDARSLPAGTQSPTMPGAPLTSTTPTIPARTSSGELPKLDAVEAGAAKPTRGEGAPGVASNKPRRDNSAATGLRSGVLVVSASRPAEIASEQWEPSLANAIKRVADQPAVLEIRGTVRLGQPVVLVDQDLELVAYPGSNALLQVSGDVLEGSRSAGFVLSRSRVRISGLQLQVNAMALQSQACLFRVLEGSTLTTEACQVRVSAVAAGDAGSGMIGGTNPLRSPQAVQQTLVSVFEVMGGDASETGGSGLIVGANAESNSSGIKTPPAMLGASTTVSSGIGSQQSGSSSSLPIVLSCNQSQFLGGASLICVRPMLRTTRPRVELSVEDCLVALEGVALHLTAETGIGSSERILRLYCKNSTFVTNDGFAVLSYRGEQQPLLGFSRNSQSCAYWSPSDVPHLSILGDTPGLLENPNLLALQGFDNAYDERITSICKTFSGGTEIFDLDFADGQQEGWFSERSIEREVRWLSEPSLARPFAQAQTSDFAIEEAMFTPGYRP